MGIEDTDQANVAGSGPVADCGSRNGDTSTIVILEDIFENFKKKLEKVGVKTHWDIYDICIRIFWVPAAIVAWGYGIDSLTKELNVWHVAKVCAVIAAGVLFLCFRRILSYERNLSKHRKKACVALARVFREAGLTVNSQILGHMLANANCAKSPLERTLKSPAWKRPELLIVVVTSVLTSVLTRFFKVPGDGSALSETATVFMWQLLGLVFISYMFWYYGFKTVLSRPGTKSVLFENALRDLQIMHDLTPDPSIETSEENKHPSQKESD